MEHAFFKPWVGEDYQKGIRGKKILVLGASFYCNQKDCKFFAECTSPDKKDSSKFDETCPYYAKIDGHPKLSEEPINAIEDCIRVYKIFAKFMYQFIEDKENYEGYDAYVAWDRMAFTDYVQFFLPTKDTYPWYLSSRDFDAFLEVIKQLKPDIIIAWGLPVTQEIRDNAEHKDYFVDLDQLPENEYYLCHMRIPEVEHDIAYINCYHPSAPGYWGSNKDIVAKYIQLAFNS